MSAILAAKAKEIGTDVLTDDCVDIEFPLLTEQIKNIPSAISRAILECGECGSKSPKL